MLFLYPLVISINSKDDKNHLVSISHHLLLNSGQKVYIRYGL